jgi:hypothetical protein
MIGADWYRSALRRRPPAHGMLPLTMRASVVSDGQLTTPFWSVCQSNENARWPRRNTRLVEYDWPAEVYTVAHAAWSASPETGPLLIVSAGLYGARMDGCAVWSGPGCPATCRSNRSTQVCAGGDPTASAAGKVRYGTPE